MHGKVAYDNAIRIAVKLIFFNINKLLKEECKKMYYSRLILDSFKFNYINLQKI